MEVEAAAHGDFCRIPTFFHGITEWFGLEGISNLIQFHPQPWAGTLPPSQVAQAQQNFLFSIW